MTNKLGANMYGTNNQGCLFHVWAPHARNVILRLGSGNTLNQTYPMTKNASDNIWSVNVPGAQSGWKYHFEIQGPDWAGDDFLYRPDPNARQMVHSASHSIIKDHRVFQWTDGKFYENFNKRTFEEMIIYELHVSTFVGKNDGQPFPGIFQSLKTKLDYLKNLGINTIEMLPIHEYAGDSYLGYAPVAFYPVESSYGSKTGTSYDDLKDFINTAHGKDIAVIADVVFNHFTDRMGSDKWIWNYDGDTKYSKGGIYFSGEETQWGPAPDWSTPEVRRYVEDTCRFYLEELHFDGLRWDVTKEIVNKNNGSGWNGMRDILWNLRTTPGFENKIFIAEHLPYEVNIVEPGNFHSGWYVEFHHSLEKALGGNQGQGSTVEEGINGGSYNKIYQRVIYSIGHDEARNGNQYLVSQFGSRASWDARAKCRLIGSLQFFVPGIPMMWQGEEFFQDGVFDDYPLYDHAVNWQYQMDAPGLQMQKMYKDAIQVRQYHTALQYGHLTWTHYKDPNGVLAFLRRDPVNGQVVLVVVNFSGTDWINNHSYGVGVGDIRCQWVQVFCSQDAEYGGWQWAGNAFHEPWTQNDGKIYLNVPKYGVIVMRPK
ncbi:MAG: alpha-amylase family glycosyl hydrolase [Magnetococcus sp. DMHC-1]